MSRKARLFDMSMKSGFKYFEINPSILSVAISLVARNGLLIGYNLFTKTYRFYSEAKWPVLFKKNAIFYDGRHFYTTKGRDRFL